MAVQLTGGGALAPSNAIYERTGSDGNVSPVGSAIPATRNDDVEKKSPLRARGWFGYEPRRSFVGAQRGHLPVELLDVGVIDWTDERVSARVRVALDGETVDEGSYELGAESGRLLDCAWPSDPGRFAVAARFEGDDEWEERDVTDAESVCAVVRVMIEGAPDSPSLPISRACGRYDDRW